MSRQLIVVDCETTGLRPWDAVLEVAAVNVDTGEEFAFVPYVSQEDLAKAEPIALQINRYYERGVWQHTKTEAETVCWWRGLRKRLEGNTFAGSNPTFDSGLVSRKTTKVWHHRLADLAAYAAGKLDIDPTDLPGADKVFELLDIEIAAEDRHTALGDARATAEAFRLLRNYF